MLELVPIGLAMVVSWSRGGRLRDVVSLDFKRGWIVLVALLVQVGALSLLGSDSQYFPALFIVSFLGLFVFFALNLKLPWIWLISIGVALNFVVITANGGYMPVDLTLIGQASLTPEALGHARPITEATILSFLGDVIPVRIGIPGFNGLISVGDIVLALGAALFIQWGMLSSRPRHIR